MNPARPLSVVLCWHMHQPDYRDVHGQYQVPWTYLHACKDYVDMAAHLEENPGAQAVFNFVPVLVDQLEDYVQQFASGVFRDRLLLALATPDLKTLDEEARHYLLDQCFRLDPEHMLLPFPGYRRLRDLKDFINQDAVEMRDYLSVQYLSDVLVWYHLAWTGETVRRSDPVIQSLMEKGSGFSAADRQALLQALGTILGNILPRYRALAAEGRIELSTTPYQHPLAPLLIDFTSARDGVPDAPLPVSQTYPGGAERVAWHLERALGSHARRFPAPAAGLWPAEGAVSPAFLQQIGATSVQWTASGEGVLARSLAQSGGECADGRRCSYLYRPYRLAGHGPAIFFRDDALSDRIGFDYKSWSGHDAAIDLVQRLEGIWRATEDQEAPIVSIILDGENAWEYYPYNGYYFLSELYQALSAHPHLHLTTYQNYLAEYPASAGILTQLASGSWVYGNFSTWIGDPAKNRAWDLLCAAKEAVDGVWPELSDERKEQVARQLGRCEGSDWFWWFGDYNPADSVRDFDLMYRQHLQQLYALLALPIPDLLHEPLCHGGGAAESGGTMRRGQA